jgi:outer membrane lipoprotein SlyB
LKFDQIKVNSRTYPLRATVTKTIESEGVEGEIGKIGAGAGLGGLIGGIIGGAKGAITGILIGAGGVIAATEGEDVDLPVASVVRIRIDSPLDLGS